MSRGAPSPPVTYDGEWDADLTYDPLIITQHDGATYLSVARSAGSEPDPELLTPWLPLGGGGLTWKSFHDTVPSSLDDMPFTEPGVTTIILGTVSVYLNGLLQRENIDYEIDGDSVVFFPSWADAVDGDRVDVRFGYR